MSEPVISEGRASGVMSAGSPYATLLKTRMLRAVERWESICGMSLLRACTVAAARGLAETAALSCKACNTCTKCAAVGNAWSMRVCRSVSEVSAWVSACLAELFLSLIHI